MKFIPILLVSLTLATSAYGTDTPLLGDQDHKIEGRRYPRFNLMEGERRIQSRLNFLAAYIDQQKTFNTHGHNYFVTNKDREEFKHLFNNGVLYILSTPTCFPPEMQIEFENVNEGRHLFFVLNCRKQTQVDEQDGKEA